MATQDATQLWEAVRAISDIDLDNIQTTITKFYSNSHLYSKASLSGQNNAIPLQFGDKVQYVRVDDFVHVFLDFLHHKVQLHTDNRYTSTKPTSPASQTLKLKNMATLKSHLNMATFDPNDAVDDEFLQLTSVHAANKTPKRRITTTLLTSKKKPVLTCPLPLDIAFPPLTPSESITKSSLSTKRSLLEKRMATSSSIVSPLPWRPTQIVNKPMLWSKKEMGTFDTKMATSDTQMATVLRKTKNKEEDKDVDVSKKKVNGLPQYQVKKQSSSSQGTCFEPKKMKENLSSKNLNEDKNHVQVTSIVLATDYSVNKQAAKLYGFLIKGRFVNKTCAELQVLISLLYRADCTICNKDPLQLENVENNVVKSFNEKVSEFCWRTHCLDFAEIVLREIEPVLVHLGADLLTLVKQSLQDAEGRCSDTLERLNQVSRQYEELRVAESARIGYQLPVEMMASAVQDFALPFNEETDSRLHYRTPVESLLYTNREKIRDGFLSLLRQFQQKQHSLIGIDNAGVAAAAIAAARKLLAEVSPENRWWFAKFFVQELIQVGSNPFGESDKDLVLKIMEDKLVVKNPDRLRKLHRRFSSQKPSTKPPQRHMQGSGSASSGSSSSSYRTSGKGSSSSQRTNRPGPQTISNEDDATKTFMVTLERMKSFFTDNQLFFFHFLHSCDSYEFSELVKHQLERQFNVIHRASAASLDARKDFTEVVLRLKVVAKFLGYLRFSPQWQVTFSIRQLSKHNAAFKAVEREGIDTLEVARDSSLDVKTLLENSILQASISKCVPWLCDYLSMLSLDRLSSGTTYFKQLVALLQLLYRSPRLNSLGETGLYIAMQLERVFHVLHMGDCLLHSDGYQSQELSLSWQVRKALARDHDVSPDESKAGAGEDHLPFLYSQVFVQSCVSELDDLRGFIQTRASKKLSVGSGTMATKQTIAPIRKLRPLQVVIEDDHRVDTIFSFAVKSDDAVHATLPEIKLPTASLLSSFVPLQEENDKLSDALFKMHPKLKPVVDFVVRTVTMDVCEHVLANVVMPRADTLVDRCASDSGLLSIGKSASSSVGEDSAFAARASFQMLITSKTRNEANSTVVAALQIALSLGEERVNTAIPPFMFPSSHPTLTNSIMSVALQRTMSTLKTLVPKSSQTEFVKRIAFRKKSLLKELGSTSKVTAAALPASATLSNTSRGPTPAQNTVTNVEIQETPPEEGKRYRELKRCVAAILTSANYNGSRKSTLAEWELQAITLSQSVSHFTASLRECVVSGDLTRDPASPLSISALGLWDIVWRAMTSCVTFLRLSLDVFAACELLSMHKERVMTVEKVFIAFATTFSAMLETIVCCVGNTPGTDIAVSRLQSMLVFLVDCMKNLPPAVSDQNELLGQFAVRANSLIVAKLQEVMAYELDRTSD
ncbi:unnamed protein product [Peronospora effusa]|nr:unnamed protein product [Peronospora effusa]